VITRVVTLGPVKFKVKAEGVKRPIKTSIPYICVILFVIKVITLRQFIIDRGLQKTPLP